MPLPDLALPPFVPRFSAKLLLAHCARPTLAFVLFLEHYKYFLPFSASICWCLCLEHTCSGSSNGLVPRCPQVSAQMSPYQRGCPWLLFLKWYPILSPLSLSWFIFLLSICPSYPLLHKKPPPKLSELKQPPFYLLKILWDGDPGVLEPQLGWASWLGADLICKGRHLLLSSGFLSSPWETHHMASLEFLMEGWPQGELDFLHGGWLLPELKW